MKKIFKILKREHMTESEKTTLANAVNLAMTNFPARQSVSTFKQWQMFLQPQHLRWGAALTAFVLIFVISGGTALAAEDAVPGDLLYPIKINVNEKVRDSLTFNEEAKVEWEVKKTERRLAEIQRLAEKSKLKGKILIEATENYDDQVRKVQDRIQKLQKKGEQSRARDLEKKIVEIKQDRELNIEILVNKKNSNHRDEKNEQQIRRFIEKLEEPANPPSRFISMPEVSLNTTSEQIDKDTGDDRLLEIKKQRSEKKTKNRTRN